jgi:hypothetical protein
VVLRVPILYAYGEHDHNFIPQLLMSIRNNEHKIQVGKKEKVFKFLCVKKAADVHVLAICKLLDQTTASRVAGDEFSMSDSLLELFFDFPRRCYTAADRSIGGTAGCCVGRGVGVMGVHAGICATEATSS